MKKNNVVAYSMSFASYLVQNVTTVGKIRNIILFGSVARGDFELKSDIDIFIDTTEDIEKEAFDILDSFYESIIYKKYWKLLDEVKNISLSVGDLKKWELRDNIISHGIVLYGKYMESIDGKLYSLFTVSVEGKSGEKLKSWRKLYGYKQKTEHKTYVQKGIIEEVGATRIGPSVFTVPLENSNKIRQFLKSNKIRFKVIDFQSESDIERIK
ncbi:MAG: nucleotidyltransferase domain-containing protein [Candidatus Aenigmarchaeota archaeon]|nr:nucleotidyltransferase domain-containing protein [Candidatus Aenigmarchaeota archaeon]MCK5322427.1 nucleotidyltransferase domain-containing protein [Candidatus Aenigmarchaeota archaeon]